MMLTRNFDACFELGDQLICGRRAGALMNTTKNFWIAAALLLAAAAVPRASAQSGITNLNGRNLTCASDDGRRHYCQVNTGGGVRMVNQRSGSPCIQGQTWGWDRGGVWVDRGCRADFVLGSGGNGPGYRPPPGNGYYPPPPPMPGPSGGTITCSSNDMGYKFCSAYTGRGVRLVNQRSGSPCVQGQTWGFNNKGVWVDRGCRADFQLGR
jgi:Protein of unknown function (DUF3011)